MYTAPQAPLKWDAQYFFVHAAADHTVNGVRHDVELQVVHGPHINTAEEDAAAGGSAATHRRLAENELAAAVDGGDLDALAEAARAAAAAASSGEGDLYELQ